MRDGDGGDPCGGGRAHPGGRVLQGDAVERVHAEQVGGGEIGLGVRLAVPNLVAGDDGGEGPLGQVADDDVSDASATTW